MKILSPPLRDEPREWNRLSRAKQRLSELRAMDLTKINNRVDQAIAANKRSEHIIIGMAVLIFILGLVVASVAYWTTNAYITSGAMLFEGALYFPIRRIGRIRRDNIVLQTFPAMMSALPPDRAADEIIKLLEFVKRT